MRSSHILLDVLILASCGESLLIDASLVSTSIRVISVECTSQRPGLDCVKSPRSFDYEEPVTGIDVQVHESDIECP